MQDWPMTPPEAGESKPFAHRRVCITNDALMKFGCTAGCRACEGASRGLRATGVPSLPPSLPAPEYRARLEEALAVDERHTDRVNQEGEDIIHPSKNKRHKDAPDVESPAPMQQDEPAGAAPAADDMQVDPVRGPKEGRKRHQRCSVRLEHGRESSVDPDVHTDGPTATIGARTP